MRKELAELGLKRLLGFYYGRAFKRSSAPRSAEEKPKDKELPQELERLPRAKESNLRTTIEAIDRIIELLGFQGEDYFTKTPTVHVHRTEPVQIRESTSIEDKEVNDLNYQERKTTLFRKEAEQ
ncbi:hypothetical protein WUBG_11376 [Wuchereria bancrofti]|uniref:Uncharacterized protein n=1 Tax=Wuchereria bancrofti TaxID=6293 RepID=J9E603_WUCBA|nr:hypothetical protein WUBG_11376 [Wuchereria bancrofti]